MNYKMARKRGERDHLPLVIYRNLLSVWRGVLCKKREPSDAVDYIWTVKRLRPEIYRGFIKTIRVMSKNKLRPFGLCDYEGCRETSVTKCYIYHGNGEETKERLCWEHARDAGYCPSCGNFWAGTEYFDFNLGGAGLCYDCTEEFKYETGEYDDDYNDYDYYDDVDDIFDED